MPKKAAAITTAAKPKSKKKTVDARQEILAKELKGLIPQLDSEGLEFLVEQARVHIYNMQVDELNKAAIAEEEAFARSKSIAKKTAGVSAAAASKGDNFSINGTESGSSFYLRYRNGDVMFSRDEMTRLAKIANAPASDMEIRERLYNWFDRERRDVFAVIPLTGRADSKLKTLAEMIRKNFKLKR